MSRGKLPFNTVKKLMKNSGAGYISRESVNYLRMVLEDEARMITAQAAVLMGYAGRKTLLSRDLQLAMMKTSELLKDVSLKGFVNKEEGKARNKGREASSKGVEDVG